MNLWLRFFWLILTTRFRGSLDAPFGTSKLHFRVLPNDLDMNLHMNNGRYLTIADLGRLDLVLRTGLWSVLRRHGAIPILSAAKIRFRRELKPFQRFRLETRVVLLKETAMVMEHRFIAYAPDGTDVLAAIALMRGGMYDRANKRFITVEQLSEWMGITVESPEASEEVLAFLDAEDALRRAN